MNSRNVTSSSTDYYGSVEALSPGVGILIFRLIYISFALGVLVLNARFLGFLGRTWSTFSAICPFLISASVAVALLSLQRLWLEAVLVRAWAEPGEGWAESSAQACSIHTVATYSLLRVFHLSVLWQAVHHWLSVLRVAERTEGAGAGVEGAALGLPDVPAWAVVGLLWLASASLGLVTQWQGVSGRLQGGLTWCHDSEMVKVPGHNVAGALIGYGVLVPSLVVAGRCLVRTRLLTRHFLGAFAFDQLQLTLQERVRLRRTVALADMLRVLGFVLLAYFASTAALALLFGFVYLNFPQHYVLPQEGSEVVYDTLAMALTYTPAGLFPLLCGRRMEAYRRHGAAFSISVQPAPAAQALAHGRNEAAHVHKQLNIHPGPGQHGPPKPPGTLAHSPHQPTLALPPIPPAHPIHSPNPRGHWDH